MTGTDGDDLSFKSRAAQWLFNQGASTILLFAIAAGIWKAAPYILEKIEVMADKHEAAQKQARTDFSVRAERQEKVFSDTNQAMSDSIDELVSELKRSK